ncbi:hypothetical protein ZIOFF_025227 [Zingiber officinale]|uniref:Uncharacterized protein n=1 Tax=Zingiber officinale TaxID=94328 RepID=A0A8J5GTM9_ZINOF|nr:hypothetical protein ZIOFF_025227 [Zingiber officinale]
MSRPCLVGTPPKLDTVRSCLVGMPVLLHVVPPEPDMARPCSMETIVPGRAPSSLFYNGFRVIFVPSSHIALGVLPSYDLCTIKAATNDFSNENKLGEGGFGVV